MTVLINITMTDNDMLTRPDFPHCSESDLVHRSEATRRSTSQMHYLSCVISF